ncbi:uncharacterized protein TNCV_393431 [Trichonephila clavipes]|nr:uncharacterized protein TNCV_393431 [Trichonephila clavipes]
MAHTRLSQWEGMGRKSTILEPCSNTPHILMSPIRKVVSDAEFCAVGSNPGEDMDACKCIVPLRHGDILNSRRATSPLVRLVEAEEKWEASDHPQDVLLQNWGESRAKSFCHLCGAQS